MTDTFRTPSPKRMLKDISNQEDVIDSFDLEAFEIYMREFLGVSDEEET